MDSEPQPQLPKNNSAQVLRAASEIEYRGFAVQKPGMQTLEAGAIIQITDQIPMLNEESEGKRANIGSPVESQNVKGIMVQGHEISAIQGELDNQSSFARLLANQNFMSTITDANIASPPNQPALKLRGVQALPALASIDVGRIELDTSRSYSSISKRAAAMVASERSSPKISQRIQAVSYRESEVSGS